MELHGKQLIGFGNSAAGRATFTGTDPSTQAALPTAFCEATSQELDQAVEQATKAYAEFRKKAPQEIADFLLRVASEVEALGDTLLERTSQETGLPMVRLTGERGRTITQLRIFADVARRASWVNARIDQADPERKPDPKPDVRTMNIPVGPVAVFGASNFPLAISVIGNDTVAALSVGCPVVVKAHPAHPGASELVGRAVVRAAQACRMPEGVFSMLHGTSHEIGQRLAKHPGIRAVAFTGSLRGGRALFDAAQSRPEPIPVYAEMGSLNPVLVLPGALAQNSEQIAQGLVQSVTLGVGQFCTKPGLVLGERSAQFDSFLKSAKAATEAAQPATMLHGGILRAYEAGLEAASSTPGVERFAKSRAEGSAGKTEAKPTLLITSSGVFERTRHLSDENFGPSALVVKCDDRAALERQVEGLSGHLAASVYATEKDLEDYADIIALLETKVGRIVVNGFTTGIDLCTAIHHGGPYPATTFGAFSSMGQTAYQRFVRPVCYQGFPQSALPTALKNNNELGIFRTVDGELTKADL